MALILDILIVGAGFAGLTAAIALAERGHKVTVLERYADLNPYGSAVGLGPQIARILDQLGLLEDFQKAGGGENRGLYYRRWKNGEVLMRFPPEDAIQRFGYRMILAKRRDFQQVLYEAARQRGVSIRFSCPVAGVEPQVPSVQLVSGETLTAHLIIAADGIKSIIRDKLYPGKHKLFSGIDDYLCTVPLHEIQDNPKLSPILDHSNFWWGPKGAVVMTVAGVGKDRCVFGEFCYLGHSGDEGDWNKEADMNELRANFASWEPNLQEFLSYVNTAKVLRLAYTNPEIPWVHEDNKVVLIGDAAHALLPHTGAGATSGMEDGFTIAECLNRVTSHALLVPALHAFEAIRRPRCEFLKDFGLKMAQERHIPDGPEQEARDQKWKQQAAMMASRVSPEVQGHIDEPPVGRPDLVRHYLMGHDVIGYANRKLDEILGVAPKASDE